MRVRLENILCIAKGSSAKLLQEIFQRSALRRSMCLHQQELINSVSFFSRRELPRGPHCLRPCGNIDSHRRTCRDNVYSSTRSCRKSRADYIVWKILREDIMESDKRSYMVRALRSLTRFASLKLTADIMSSAHYPGIEARKAALSKVFGLLGVVGKDLCKSWWIHREQLGTCFARGA